ncbi:P450-derived glycosyltransferase activator [Streptomyces sp. A0592]|uniref:cytochrome P450 family protein n=1 Tax=Streptomyces sp. A0592 TaxID=2563099 RepID=UPI00109EC8DD|nr:P450-derived glycosyltransferase activator [Streptomyces sp. A0592]THA82882.1 P450-derived glycosyltransferase activator [Streptomyces sp. A0592]
MVTMNESELGRVLLTHRGVQWIIGTKDDPYALLVRAAGDDPHRLGELIRERGPLYRSSAEAWVTAHHEVAAAALADPRLSVRHPDEDAPAAQDGEEQREPMPWEVPALREILPFGEAFLTAGRADCERVRELLEPLLGAKALERRRAGAEQALRRALDGAGSGFDLRTEVADPFAAGIVRELLGVPEEDHDRFAALCRGAAGLLDATVCSPHLRTARELIASVEGMGSLFADLIAQRREKPGGDLVSALLAATDEEEVRSVCTLLALVGTELSATLFCDAVAELLDHPAQWRALCADPRLAAAVVEETLRHAPPVRLVPLYAREDLELAGTPVPAGGQVVVAVEAAGRDCAVHAEPGAFDPARERTAEPLAFAEGLPVSLSAPTARFLAEAGLRALAAEAPGLRPAGPALRRLRSGVTGAVIEMPVAR